MKYITLYCYKCNKVTIFVQDKREAECLSCGSWIRGFWGIRISWEIKDICAEERKKLWEEFLEERGRGKKNQGAEGR